MSRCPILDAEAILTIRHLALCLVVLLLVLDSPTTDAAPKNVLVIYDEDKKFPGLAILHDSLRTSFTVELLSNVDFYTESLRPSQFRDPGSDRTLRDHYQRRYAGKSIDLIVAVMGPSLDFLLRHRRDHLPRNPARVLRRRHVRSRGQDAEGQHHRRGGEARLRAHAGSCATASPRDPPRVRRRRGVALRPPVAGERPARAATLRGPCRRHISHGPHDGWHGAGLAIARHTAWCCT
jgi:hypothetical protein